MLAIAGEGEACEIALATIFTQAVVDTLDAEKSIVMTLHEKSRNALLQDIRRRDELRLLEVTPVNKDLLAFKIVALLTGKSH